MIVDEIKKKDFVVGSDLPRAFSEKSTISHTLEYVSQNDSELAFKSFKSH